MTFLSKLRSVRTRTWAVLALVTAVVAVPASLYAWGPGRDTFTMANPADHVTFNSITDNPNIGDERNFVGIRESGTSGLWQDSQTVQSGKEYVVRLYVHNNAASNLNLVAHNVTAKVSLPTATATSIEVQGFINSSNATPTEVYDHATFTAAENFNLAVVPGSLKYYNNANGNGFSLADSLFTSTGATLGYTSMNGDIPGCNQYAGYLTFIVKPQFAPSTDFTVTKQVRKVGTTTWSKTLAVNPGDEVEYMISYKNAGAVPQDNVVVYDKLPSGVSYKAGTTYVKNGTNPSGIKVSDNVVTAQGINVGNYDPAAAAYVKFAAKVTSLDKLACGLNTLNNVAKVTTDYGTKQDTASVTLTKTCESVYVKACNLATMKIEDRVDESKIDNVHYTTDLAKCTPAQNKVFACNLVTSVIEQVDESKIDNIHYTKDTSKCAEQVCVVKDKSIVTIKKSDFDSNKHSRTLSDCDTSVPTTPTELPHTGIAGGVFNAIGLGSLVGISSAYLASRRVKQN